MSPLVRWVFWDRGVNNVAQLGPIGSDWFMGCLVGDVKDQSFLEKLGDLPAL